MIRHEMPRRNVESGDEADPLRRIRELIDFPLERNRHQASTRSGAHEERDARGGVLENLLMRPHQTDRPREKRMVAASRTNDIAAA